MWRLAWPFLSRHLTVRATNSGSQNMSELFHFAKLKVPFGTFREKLHLC